MVFGVVIRGMSLASPPGRPQRFLVGRATALLLRVGAERHPDADGHL